MTRGSSQCPTYRPFPVTYSQWANADHVPDIIDKHAAHNGMNHVLYESKVYTPLKRSDNLGNGTARSGGSPCTAAGNLVAF
eukprot:175493-Prymnesium_polylepis.1